MSVRNAISPSASWPSSLSSAPPASALIRVRVPSAEFDRRDVRPAILAQNPRGRLHQRRDAAAPRAAAGHRLFANEILLLHRRFEAAVEHLVRAIQRRQADPDTHR